jgi:hypothetical protein
VVGRSIISLPNHQIIKLFLITLFTLHFSLFTAFAQIAFEQTSVSGIEIAENDPPREFRFAFTNTGTKPIVVTKVETSCGCTVADYNKQPVAAGQHGAIRLTYNPHGNVGRLSRTIAVYTSDLGSTPAAQLQLSGNVTPAPGSDPWAARYPVVLGGELRTKRNRMEFGAVLPTQVRQERLECVNTGDKPLTLSAMPGVVPEWITLATEPATIEPGAVGDIVVTIDGRHMYDVNARGTIDLTLIVDGLTGRPSARSIHIAAETAVK